MTTTAKLQVLLFRYTISNVFHYDFFKVMNPKYRHQNFLKYCIARIVNQTKEYVRSRSGIYCEKWEEHCREGRIPM